MNKRFFKALVSLLMAVVYLSSCVTAVYAQEEEKISSEDDEVVVIEEEVLEPKIYDLPEIIMKEVRRQEKNYPGIEIGVGLYSLDGKIGYEYNSAQVISGGCTIKAPYALYVLLECEKQDIDIYNTEITYKEWMMNTGSGIIKNSKYGTKYTIAYLLEKLLDISDNTAYNILTSKFSLSGFRKFLNGIDGQKLGSVQQYGEASVVQRKNEWLKIYEYIQSGSHYSDALRGFLTNTEYCYLVKKMEGDHEYMHKSGWSYFTKKSKNKYSSCCDCAIIDENYLLIVMTQDYETGESHSRAVKKIGLSVEKYANSLDKNGLIF